MKLLAILGLLAMLCACGPMSSNDAQDQAQEQMNAQAVQAVGTPAITHFFEKRQLKSIFELRDQAVSTYTYLQDLQGHLHKLCDSVGFGIPYSTQFTAPESMQYSHMSLYELPQEDPNGLYSPADAAGTWVLCLNPATKQTQPVYVEPNVVVSQFPLQTT